MPEKRLAVFSPAHHWLNFYTIIMEFIAVTKSMIFNPILAPLFSFLTALLIALVSVPVVINISKEKKLMDTPNGRSSHTALTPTMGGIAVFAGLAVSTLIWVDLQQIHGLNFFVASAIILFFIGLKDDILVIAPWKKFVAQLFVSLLVIVGGDIRLENFCGILNIYELPYWISVGFSLVIFLGVTNAYNLIDGVDGLAGGLSLLAMSAFGTWFALAGEHSLAVLAFAAMGATAGFLRYNLSKNKKIFMGDTGSLLLGFTITVLALKFLSLNNPGTSTGFAIRNAPVFAVLALLLPVFDMMRVFFIRILDNKSPFHPDKRHIHHLLLNFQLSHANITLLLVSMNAVFLGVFLFLGQELAPNTHFLVLTVFFAFYTWICRETKPLTYQQKKKMVGTGYRRHKAIMEKMRHRQREVAGIEETAVLLALAARKGRQH